MAPRYAAGQVLCSCNTKCKVLFDREGITSTVGGEFRENHTVMYEASPQAYGNLSFY